jgi:hypothetical protein
VQRPIYFETIAQLVKMRLEESITQDIQVIFLARIQKYLHFIACIFFALRFKPPIESTTAQNRAHHGASRFSTRFRFSAISNTLQPLPPPHPLGRPRGSYRVQNCPPEADKRGTRPPRGRSAQAENGQRQAVPGGPCSTVRMLVARAHGNSLLIL